MFRRRPAWPRWPLALALALLPLSAQGADINELFSQFNEQMSAGSLLEAERTARQMLDTAPTPAWEAASRNALGRALNGQERYAEAAEQLEKGLAIPLGSTNTNRGWIPNNLAHNYRKQGKLTEAEKLLEQARAEFERLFTEQSEEVATVQSNLGWLRFDQGKFAAAAEIQAEVLALRRELFGEGHSLVGSSLSDLGATQTKLRQFAESEKNLTAALDIKRKTAAASPLGVAVVLGNLADLYRAREQFSLAEKYARQELAIRQALFGRQSKLVAESLTEIAGDLEKQGKDAAAQPVRDEAGKIAATLAAGPAVPENPFRVGQRVEVWAERASVMAGANSLGFAAQGTAFRVTHVNGKWCGVRIVAEGAEKSGWIDSNLLTLAPVALPAPLDLTHAVESRAGGFRILMPAEPALAQETISGIRHTSYTLESTSWLLAAGYFDLPAGMDLTFDAAVAAYIAEHRGKVQSEDKLSLADEYPGREWLVSLPEEQFCRMRLFAVKSRRYQLVVEGPRETVSSDEATAFFNSFALIPPAAAP
ncbi:MAG: tetratricopeptide repeat protein [Pirellulaceae bacterium]|nr:tetratricopeptide repeat protein [Pirellulaceae bacterium]